MFNFNLMRKLLYIVLLLSFFTFSNKTASAQCNSSLVTVCSAKLSKDATYLKELRARLKPQKTGQQKPVARFSLLLNKGNHYRFNVCNAEEFDSKAVVQLYERNKLLGSSFFANYLL